MELVHVFTYGSLMFPPVWERLTGGGHRALPGTLRGFARRRVSGAPYPALVRAEADATVRGVLYRDVSPADLRALDHFEAEGELYERIPVTVELDRGTAAEAWTYRYLLAERVEPDPWDPARFEREDLRHFLDRRPRPQAPRQQGGSSAT